jgi:DNA-binding response OmpR family regulator
MSRRILIVEDDAALARVLKDNLEFEGFLVESAADGREALHKARQFAPDLLILDVMVPSVNGFQICEELSRGPARTPIIMVTARTQKEDKIRGLELGADDYVAKPFALDELLARVHAVLRRTQPRVDKVTIGDVLIDFRLRHASRGNRKIDLSHREFEVLRYLVERAGKSVHRDELLRSVWGYSDAPLSRAVDNLIGRLRRKIEQDPRRPRYIRTAHGDGYCLTLDD